MEEYEHLERLVEIQERKGKRWRETKIDGGWMLSSGRGLNDEGRDDGWEGARKEERRGLGG